MRLLRTAATNVAQTAASRSQNHLCPGTFMDASLNIIGYARLVRSAGPVFFIRRWSRTLRDFFGGLLSLHHSLPSRSIAAGCGRAIANVGRRRGNQPVQTDWWQHRPYAGPLRRGDSTLESCQTWAFWARTILPFQLVGSGRYRVHSRGTRSPILPVVQPIPKEELRQGRGGPRQGWWLLLSWVFPWRLGILISLRWGDATCVTYAEGAGSLGVGKVRRPFMA
jgi:hypothetical protein